MMNGWLMLDRLAAAHGDGLNPALREMLDARAAVDSPTGNIVEIAKLRGDLARQSGPVPAPAIIGPLPGNIVRFPRRAG